MRTNCKNCGAVIDPNLDRCPYCGTRYLDLAITIGEPFYIRFRNNSGEIFEAKAIMRNDITLECNADEICMGDNISFYSNHNSPYLTIKLDLLNDNMRYMTIYKGANE